MAGLAGVGKSTLAERLGVSLRRTQSPDSARSVDVFGEEELFTRPEFARVADGFRTERYASPADFEAAYQKWLSSLDDGAVAITDWSPAGMTGDLPWALDNSKRYLRHLEAVRRIGADNVVLLHLLAPPQTTIDRAGRQRGREWVERSDRTARAAGHRQSQPRDRLIAEATRHAAQTQRELDAAMAAGWRVRRIDATAEPDVVHDRALGLLGWDGTRVAYDSHPDTGRATGDDDVRP